jgi:hypothetical protein
MHIVIGPNHNKREGLLLGALRSKPVHVQTDSKSVEGNFMAVQLPPGTKLSYLFSTI